MSGEKHVWAVELDDTAKLRRLTLVHGALLGDLVKLHADMGDGEATKVVRERLFLAIGAAFTMLPVDQQMVVAVADAYERAKEQL